MTPSRPRVRLAVLVVALVTVTSAAGVAGAAPGPTDRTSSIGAAATQQVDADAFVGASVRDLEGRPVTTAGTGVTVDVLDGNGTVVARALTLNEDGQTRRVGVDGGATYRTRLNLSGAVRDRVAPATGSQFVPGGTTAVVPMTVDQRAVPTELRVIDIDPDNGLAYANGDDQITLTVRAVDTGVAGSPSVADVPIRIRAGNDTRVPDALGYPNGTQLRTGTNGTVTFAVTSTEPQDVRFTFEVPNETTGLGTAGARVRPASVEVGPIATLRGAVRGSDGDRADNATVTLVRTTAFGDGTPGAPLAAPLTVARTAVDERGAFGFGLRPGASYRLDVTARPDGAATVNGSATVTVNESGTTWTDVTVPTGNESDAANETTDTGSNATNTTNATVPRGDRRPSAVSDGSARPTDPDGDGVFEDVDGSGAVSVLDVRTLLVSLDEAAVEAAPAAFDIDGSGNVTVLDVVALLESL